MAAPITHIILALHLLQSALLPYQHDIAKFIRGTSFPDIRYLVGIEREKTHRKNITWADVEQEQNSFLAGMYFHVFIDELRIEQLEQSAFHAKFNLNVQDLSHAYASKLAEDRLLYQRYPQDWQLICSYLNTADQEVFAFGVRSEDVLKWYKLIQEHCISGINDHFIVTKICKPNEHEKNKKIVDMINFLKNNSEFEETSLNFYNNVIEAMYKNASPVPAILV